MTLIEFTIVVLVAVVPMVLVSRAPKMTHPRTLRRVTVVAAYAGISVYACTWIFAAIAGISEVALQALSFGIVALLIGVLALGVVFVWNRNAHPASERLDERLILRRDKTYAIAFQVLAIVCSIEGVLWYSRASIGLPRTIDFTSLFVAIDFFLVISLPPAILAWHDPDAVDD